jgi:hypothetical protein
MKSSNWVNSYRRSRVTLALVEELGQINKTRFFLVLATAMLYNIKSMLGPVSHMTRRELTLEKAQRGLMG